MPDRREEILNGRHLAETEKDGMQSISTKHFPLAYKDAAISAMDEYMKECAFELIDYIHKNAITFGYIEGKQMFGYKGRWINKEQLFENFL